MRTVVSQLKKKILMEGRTRFWLGITLVFFAFVLVTFYKVAFLGYTFQAVSLVPGVMPTGPYGYTAEMPRVAPDTIGWDSGGSSWQIVAELEKTRQELWAGKFPVWNPNQMFGSPLAHNMQLSALFPLRLLFYLGPQSILNDVYGLFLLIVSGLTTFLFLRRLGLRIAGDEGLAGTRSGVGIAFGEGRGAGINRWRCVGIANDDLIGRCRECRCRHQTGDGRSAQPRENNLGHDVPLFAQRQCRRMARQRLARNGPSAPRRGMQ